MTEVHSDDVKHLKNQAEQSDDESFVGSTYMARGLYVISSDIVGWLAANPGKVSYSVSRQTDEMCLHAWKYTPLHW